MDRNSACQDRDRERDRDRDRDRERERERRDSSALRVRPHSRLLPAFRQGSASRKVLGRSAARDSQVKKLLLLEEARKDLASKGLGKANLNRGLSHHRRYSSHTAKQKEHQRDEKGKCSPDPQQDPELHLPELKPEPKTDRSEARAEGFPISDLPLSGSEARVRLSRSLLEHQIVELEEVREVWWASSLQNKQRLEQYDDPSGNYNCRAGDHLAYRYQVQRSIGRGSFGQVYKAMDHKDKQLVAIKVIKSRPRLAAQALHQVKVLESLAEEEGLAVVRLRSYFQFRGHVCLVFDLLYCTLYQLIKHSHQGLPLQFVRKVGVQLAQILAQFGRRQLIHCDLKPENIMLRQKGSSQLRVIDLGSACYSHEPTSDYIQSRFYRAPEVLLGLMPFSPRIDMWSMVTVLAELVLGHPLFPGDDQSEQIINIGEVLGPPPPELMTRSQKASWYFEGGQICVLDKKGRERRAGSRPLGSMFGGPFLDFLRRGLTWLPESRMSPQEALQHPWAVGRRDESEECPQ